MTSPEHGVPPHAAAVWMPLVWACFPSPHVAEQIDHVLHSAHTQGCGGGAVVPGGGGGVTGVGSHASLL